MKTKTIVLMLLYSMIFVMMVKADHPGICLIWLEHLSVAEDSEEEIQAFEEVCKLPEFRVRLQGRVGGPVYAEVRVIEGYLHAALMFHSWGTSGYHCIWLNAHGDEDYQEATECNGTMPEEPSHEMRLIVNGEAFGTYAIECTYVMELWGWENYVCSVNED